MIKSIVRAIRGDPPPAPAPKRINLALQGGGAYGAFSWGVLDHLLDDGRLEIEGITGRAKDMIIRGGENIYPREIEEFLYTHPKISDVQVVGLPDEDRARPS